MEAVELVLSDCHSTIFTKPTYQSITGRKGASKVELANLDLWTRHPRTCR